jgi:polyketide cyclase/dehydrase/lipid transport protein
MASYSATVPSMLAPDEVFVYLADFRSVAEWDPSISESVHVNDGEPVQVAPSSV